MKSRVAIVRNVPPSIERCELTHVARTPISVDRATRQHEAYVRALERLGCRIEWAADLPDAPDSVFVEDTALVLDEIAIALRPGAESRRGEVASVASILAYHRPVLFMTGPGTLDGGDLLRIGRTVYVGRSTRSDEQGLRELAGLLEPFGYAVVPVPLTGCLHLKSAATAARDDVVVCNPTWVDPAVFGAVDVVPTDPAEPHGANVVRIGPVVVADAAHARTNRALVDRGVQVETVDLSELAKAEGAVTCCSILVG